MYKLGKSVSVRLHSHGTPVDGEVGVSADGTIFGYVSRGSLSHMSYYLDEYFVPSEVVAKAREKYDGVFHFDVGNEFTISADVLEDAFRRLGLL